MSLRRVAFGDEQPLLTNGVQSDAEEKEYSRSAGNGNGNGGGAGGNNMLNVPQSNYRHTKSLDFASAQNHKQVNWSAFADDEGNISLRGIIGAIKLKNKLIKRREARETAFLQKRAAVVREQQQKLHRPPRNDTLVTQMRMPWWKRIHDPRGRFRVCWDLVVICMLIYNLIEIPIRVCFEVDAVPWSAADVQTRSTSPCLSCSLELAGV